MKFDEFFVSLQHKNIAILNPNDKELSFMQQLLDHNIHFRIRSENHFTSSFLDFHNIKQISGENYLNDLTEDVIFSTEDLVDKEFALADVVNAQQVLTSQLDVFLKYCPCKTIAVTGSFGTACCSALISGMLEHTGHRIYKIDTIEDSYFELLETIQPEDFVVLKIPHSQLRNLNHSPDIAVITNISSYPLKKNMRYADYLNIISNIYRYQNNNGLFIFNYAYRFLKTVMEPSSGNAIEFSCRGELKQGVYVHNDFIYLNSKTKKVKLLSISELALPGNRNLESYLAAIATVSDLVSTANIKKYLSKFHGEPNHFELVRELNHIKYFNNSYASAPSVTVEAIQSFDKKIILITGGCNNSYPYKALGMEIVAFVKSLILIGDSTPFIREATEETAFYKPDEIEIFEAEGLEMAVSLARDCAVPDGVVVFSLSGGVPSEFKNYQECGDLFRTLVNNL